MIYLLFVLSVLLVSACKVQDVQPQQKRQMEIVINSGSQETGAQQPQAAADDNSGPAQPAAGGEIQQTAATKSTQSSASKVKLGEDICNEAASLGKISCSYKDKDLSLTLVNAGRGDLDGVVYRFYDVNYILIGEEQDMFSFGVGAEKELTVPLSKYDETKKIDVHPVESGKICSNKQLAVIPTTNCR